MNCRSSLLDGRAEERAGGRGTQNSREELMETRDSHVVCSAGRFPVITSRTPLSWIPAPAPASSFTVLLWTQRPVTPAIVRPPQNGCSGRLPWVGLTEKPALVCFFFSSPDFIRTTDLNELWLLLSALSASRGSGRVRRMNQHKCGAIIGKHIQSK